MGVQNGVKALAWYQELQKRQNRGTIYDRVYVLVGRRRAEEAVKGYAWTEISMMNGYEGAKEV